jgi:hypothetical protein
MLAECPGGAGDVPGHVSQDLSVSTEPVALIPE